MAPRSRYQHLSTSYQQLATSIKIDLSYPRPKKSQHGTADHLFPTIRILPTRDSLSHSRKLLTKWSNLLASHVVWEFESVISWSKELKCISKYLYNHTPSPKGGMSLDTIDAGPLCDVGSCASLGYGHRQECHKKSYEVYCERNKRLGRSCPEMKKCKTSWISFHCECYTRRTKLHFRLRTWMPKGLNYCGRCGKFTKRKKQHNGRCEGFQLAFEKKLLINWRLPWRA